MREYLVGASALIVWTVSAIGLFAISRGQIDAIRGLCGSIAAERIALAACVTAVVACVAASLAWSWLTFALAAATLAVAIAPARVLVRVTGGPDTLCLFRRTVRDLFMTLNERPFTDQALADAFALKERLNAQGTPETERVEYAIDLISRREFPDVDHAATIAAYDEFDSAIAELKGKHSW